MMFGGHSMVYRYAIMDSMDKLSKGYIHNQYCKLISCLYLLEFFKFGPEMPLKFCYILLTKDFYWLVIICLGGWCSMILWNIGGITPTDKLSILLIQIYCSKLDSNSRCEKSKDLTLGSLSTGLRWPQQKGVTSSHASGLPLGYFNLGFSL